MLRFADVMLPRVSKYNSNGGKPGGFLFAHLTTWLNSKAMLANAGPSGVCYPDFVPFEVDETRYHVGIYVLQGCSPSPHVSYKFRQQRDDPVNGNNYVFQSTDKKLNHERRHKHFKAFFTVQNPQNPCNDRDAFPNWKVRLMLQRINYIDPLA